MEQHFELVAIDEIHTSGSNPRRTFDPKKLDELARSIRTNGIIQPLVCRRANKHVMLIAGERRLRAAQLARLTEVPVVFRECTAKEAEEAQLVENLQREDVGMVEEAWGFDRMMKAHGYTVEQLSQCTGKKPRYVYIRLQLLKSSKPLLEAMEKGVVGRANAALIARVPADSQKKAVQYCAEAEADGRPISTRELDAWIKRELVLNLDSAAWAKDDEKLVKKAGSCQACPNRTGNQPELYADMRSPNVCLDPQCYERKEQAHINQVIAQHKGKLVQIRAGHEYWPQQPKHVLRPGDYKLIAKKADRCENQVDAIVVRGPGTGTVAQVCVDPKCKKHSGRAGGGYERTERSEEEVRKIREQKLELETARLSRSRVVDAILARLPATLGKGELEEMAEAWWEMLGFDRQRIIRKRHQWDADTIPVGDLSEIELARLLTEFALVNDMWVMAYNREMGVSERLRDRAEVAGVDWKGIEKAAREELAAPKKRAKKPAAVLGKVESGPAAQIAVANEYGVFEDKDCETIHMLGDEAIVLLARAADGWRSSFEAGTGDRHAGSLPAMRQLPVETREEALRSALEAVIDFATDAGGSGATKKALKDAARILGWAQGQLEKLPAKVPAQVSTSKEKGGAATGGGHEVLTSDGIQLRMRLADTMPIAHIDFHNEADGILINVGVCLPYGKKKNESFGESGPVYADAQTNELWQSRAAALPAAWSRILDLVERLENDPQATQLTVDVAAMVKAWARGKVADSENKLAVAS